MARWWTAWLCGAVIGCASDEPGAVTSTRPRDGSMTDDDASTHESPPRDGGGAAPDAALPLDAGRDATAPLPEPPDTNGVHLSIGRGAYETAHDAFFFETDRPGIQAELAGDASLRVELSEALGELRCSDGALIEYTVPEGSLRAGRDHGSCTIDVEAFGPNAGDRIVATFSATVVHASGEVADELELHGRIQVGHP